MTLVGFLLARIAEDEAEATLVASAPPKWSMTVYPHDGEEIPVVVKALQPARVLADCDAKRRIIERAAFATTLGDRAVLALLALPFADHPDYRQEWRP